MFLDKGAFVDKFVVLIRVHAALVGFELEDELGENAAQAVCARTTAQFLEIASSGNVDLALIEYRDDEDTHQLTKLLRRFSPSGTESARIYSESGAIE